MSVESQFTPEQIEALIAGETISFGKKQVGTPVNTNKIIEKEDVPVDQQPTSTTPRTSVPIAGVSKVVTPKIRSSHEAEATDVGAKITGPSNSASSRWDEIEADKAEARAEAKRLEEAEKVLKHELSPAQILNRFNATQRVVERLQKEVTSLKKQLKDQA